MQILINLLVTSWNKDLGVILPSLWRAEPDLQMSGMG